MDRTFKSGERTLTFQYSLVQGSYWMNFCVAVAYAAVFLQGAGYNNAQLGMIIAGGNLAGSVLGPVLSAWIDRNSRVSAGMLIPPVLLAQAAVEILLLLFPGRTVFLPFLYAFYIASSIAVNSLYLKLYSDAVYQGREIDYGFSRGMGSAAYVAASPVVGRLVKYVGTRIIPGVGLVFCIFQWVSFALMQSRLGAGQNGPRHTLRNPFRRKHAAPAESGNRVLDAGPRQAAARGHSMGAFIREYPRFFVLLLGTALLFFAHNTINTFMINVVRNVGGDTGTMGLFDGFMAFVEIPVMLFYTRLFRRQKNSRLLGIAFLFYIFKCAAVASAHSIPALFAAGVLQAPSFALYTAAIVPYVNEMIPYEDSAKAQSLAYTMTTCGAVLASLVSGRLYDMLPVNTVLWIGCGISIVGALTGLAGIEKRESSSK